MGDRHRKPAIDPTLFTKDGSAPPKIVELFFRLLIGNIWLHIVAAVLVLAAVVVVIAMVLAR